jgi:hypothetical protein
MRLQVYGTHCNSDSGVHKAAGTTPAQRSNPALQPEHITTRHTHDPSHSMHATPPHALSCTLKVHR